MSNTLERYRKRFEPCNLKCKSGFTWRIRRMQAEDWGHVAGGLLMLPRHHNGSAPTDTGVAEKAKEDEVKQHAEYRRLVYEHLVLGLVDEDTGKVLEKLAYSEVDPSDVTEFVEWQLAGAPNSGQVAELVGRSL